MKRFAPFFVLVGALALALGLPFLHSQPAPFNYPAAASAGVSSSGGALTNVTISYQTNFGDILPGAHDTYRIGVSGNRWSSAHFALLFSGICAIEYINNSDNSENIMRFVTGDKNAYFYGQNHITNGVASYASNQLAAATVSVTASPFSWTNTTTKNVFFLFDGDAATTSAIAVNGTTIFSSATAIPNATVPLQPGERVTVTYSAGTPTATWKPF